MMDAPRQVAAAAGASPALARAALPAQFRKDGCQYRDTPLKTYSAPLGPYAQGPIEALVGGGCF